MWAEFVVGSCSCFKGFFSVIDLQFFLPPQKPMLLNSNSMANPRDAGLSVASLFREPSFNKSIFYFIGTDIPYKVDLILIL